MKLEKTRTYLYAGIVLLILGFVNVYADAVIRISTLDDLKKIGTDSAFPLDGDYILAQDINAAATSTMNNFKRIGDQEKPFTGSFDGQGYAISGMDINLGGNSNLGFFGYTGSTARIMNLRLEGFNIYAGGNVGALVGYNGGD